MSGADCYFVAGTGVRFFPVPPGRENLIRITLRPPRIKTRYLDLADGDGAFAIGGAPTFDRSDAEIEFLYDGGTDTRPYALLVTELVGFLVRHAGRVWIVDERSAFRRRLRVEFESVEAPDRPDGNRVAKITVKCAAPYPFFEGREQIFATAAADGQMLRIPVVYPDDPDRPLPTHTIHPIWEFSSDFEIKEFALTNTGTDPARGAGERLHIQYAAYPPGYVYELDTYTRPGGSLTLRPAIGGAALDVMSAADDTSGHLRLFAGENRFQIASPQGALRITCRYRPVWVR